MIKKKYYYRDKLGVMVMSWGIELSPEEKRNLARKNLRLIKEQVNGES